MFEDNNYVYLVLEYCSGGDLEQYVNSKKRLKESEARDILGQIVEALRYLHKHNIMHRDLKLANVLLTKDMSVVSFSAI